jgi:hypothetical protein
MLENINHQVFIKYQQLIQAGDKALLSQIHKLFHSICKEELAQQLKQSMLLRSSHTLADDWGIIMYNNVHGCDIPHKSSPVVTMAIQV